MLVLGRISDDPRSHYANLRPLLDYVVARMADLGIRRGEVLMAQNTAVMQSYLRAKLVDWISETPAQALRLEPAGARPLLLAERRGRLRYRTVFFARRDTGIVDLDGLVGRRLAVQSPASTSAFLVPLGMLMDRGLAPTLLPSPRVPAPPGAVGLLLAGSEHNIAVWVHKGLADAGAFSDHDFEDLERMPAALREDLVVFARSEPFPRAIELVREDLSSAGP
ncbi:MAG: PhnD/SsuA/transferrin family substrate-binding protein [Xanthomonadales bacterium]|nr:PhnD/SsuA/transferrin family substrate-binding protein [Xanthomonadales bacterium]